MQNWGTIGPVAQNKLGEIEGMREYIFTHFNEYVESRRRAGVTLERVYLMTTPNGSFVTNYTEGRNVTAAMHSYLNSGLAFDKWFMPKISQLHGIDFTKPMPSLPEEVLFFAEEGVVDRKQGLGFCVPVLAGKLESLRVLFNDVMGPRFAELQRSNRTIGLTREVFVLNHTPNGDFIAVYLEGDDPVAANKRWATSNDPVDVWFRKTCTAATGIDFGQPLPAIRCIHDWRI